MMLDRLMGKSKQIEVTITDPEKFRRAIILTEKGNYNYNDKYSDAPIEVSVSEEDLPESVNSAEQFENRLEALIYEQIFLQ